MLFLFSSVRAWVIGHINRRLDLLAFEYVTYSDGLAVRSDQLHKGFSYGFSSQLAEEKAVMAYRDQMYLRDVTADKVDWWLDWRNWLTGTYAVPSDLYATTRACMQILRERPECVGLEEIS